MVCKKCKKHSNVIFEKWFGESNEFYNFDDKNMERFMGKHWRCGNIIIIHEHSPLFKDLKREEDVRKLYYNI